MFGIDWWLFCRHLLSSNNVISVFSAPYLYIWSRAQPIPMHQPMSVPRPTPLDAPPTQSQVDFAHATYLHTHWQIYRPHSDFRLVSSHAFCDTESESAHAHAHQKPQLHSMHPNASSTAAWQHYKLSSSTAQPQPPAVAFPPTTVTPKPVGLTQTPSPVRRLGACSRYMGGCLSIVTTSKERYFCWCTLVCRTYN